MVFSFHQYFDYGNTPHSHGYLNCKYSSESRCISLSSSTTPLPLKSEYCNIFMNIRDTFLSMKSYKIWKN